MILKSNRLHLRNPRIEDAIVLQEFYKKNAKHLAPWESVGEWQTATITAIQDKLCAWDEEIKSGKSVRIFFFPKDHPEGDLIGICNFTQIFYGGFQACYLGYKIDCDFEGKGLMKEALEAALKYVFEEVGLHRVMANYIPTNQRSAYLLYRLGFQVEGFAQNYLKINDRWEDHVLTALSKERWTLIQNGVN